MKEVKVKEDTLIKHGAVSEETAYEMAKGLISKGLDISVSITGIAGPDSDDTEKPVGLVYICLMSRDKHELMEFNFNGSRQEIQDLAVTSVFYHLREFLLKVVD